MRPLTVVRGSVSVVDNKRPERRRERRHAGVFQELVFREHLLDMLAEGGLAVGSAVEHVTAGIFVYRDA